MENPEWLALATAVLGSIGAAMGILWKSHEKNMVERIISAEKKLQECEHHHHAAMELIIELSERIGKLEGRAARK